MEFNKKYGNGSRFDRENMNNWKRKSSSIDNGKFEIAGLQSSQDSKISLQLDYWALHRESPRLTLTIKMGQAH
jgi:hypothetical protein